VGVQIPLHKVNSINYETEDLLSDTNNPCTSACNLVACADNANNLNDKVNSISSRGLVKDSESLFEFYQ